LKLAIKFHWILSKKVFAVIALLLASFGLGDSTGSRSFVQTSYFDIRMSFVHAGSLESTLSIQDGLYEFSGQMRTSKFIEHFFKWQGSFAAVGEIVDGVPVSQNYLVISDNKTKHIKKIVLKNDDTTTVLRTGSEKKKIEAPIGLDLISALLLLDDCEDEIKVHDGEEAYHLFLDAEKTRETKLRLGDDYYSGDAVVCTYQFEYKRNVVRRFNIWLANVEDEMQPVRIQLRFPFRPSVVMSMRTDKRQSELTTN